MELSVTWKITVAIITTWGLCGADDQSCQQSPVIQNGRVHYQSRGGVTAIFSCHSGFTLHGSNVSHCQTDGHWSAPTPTCVPEATSCDLKAMENINIRPGEATVLNCSSQPTPDDQKYTWIRNGNFFSPHMDFGNGSILISSNDAGLYVCLLQTAQHVGIARAVNVATQTPIGMKETKCHLVFKDANANMSVHHGSKAVISCEVDNDFVHTTWLKDNKPMNESREIAGPILHLKNVNEEDQGVYACVVRHIEDSECQASKSVVVRVLVGEKSIKEGRFQCGIPVGHQRRSKRVIDGSRASPNSAPWMCMLSTERNPVFCGCSLISDTWVVTAAHCFIITSEEELPRRMNITEVKKRVKIKFGKQQRRAMERGEVVRGIQVLEMHPQFKPRVHDEQVANEHDIALIKMDNNVIYQDNILSICLPPHGFLNTVKPGTLGIVTGWGRVSVRGSVMAVSLQEARLPLVDTGSCQESTSYTITENMLCAGYAESYRPDTCFGDSGGPYILQNNDRWYLAGIVSWGEGCSSPRKFGVYTKVEKYVPWILSTIQKS